MTCLHCCFQKHYSSETFRHKLNSLQYEQMLYLIYPHRKRDTSFFPLSTSLPLLASMYLPLLAPVVHYLLYTYICILIWCLSRLFITVLLMANYWYLGGLNEETKRHFENKCGRVKHKQWKLQVWLVTLMKVCST